MTTLRARKRAAEKRATVEVHDAGCSCPVCRPCCYVDGEPADCRDHQRPDDLEAIAEYERIHGAAALG
jgi:hypothetical protein